MEKMSFIDKIKVKLISNYKLVQFFGFMKETIMIPILKIFG